MNAQNFLYLGRGLNYPIALEGALKLKEISYIHAEGYAAGEMKHGPIALIDQNMPVVVLATRSPVLEKIQGNLEEVAARGGRLIALTEADNYQVIERVESFITGARGAPGALPHRALSPSAAFGLPHCRPQGHGRGPAPQPGKKRHRGVGEIFWGEGQGAVAPCPPPTPPSQPFKFFPEPGPLATALEDPKNSRDWGRGCGEGVRALWPLAPSPANFFPEATGTLKDCPDQAKLIDSRNVSRNPVRFVMDEKLMPRDKFHRDIEVLKEQLMKMAGLAEAALDRSITALMTRDADLAREVIKGDTVINELEEELDNACVRVIALYQPVAVDLRQVMAVDHLIVELERLGDLAVNVAEEALNLEQLPATELHRDLARMTKMVQHMLRDSLRSFLSQDAVLAREVCKQDDEVDYLDRALIRELLEYMGRSREALALGLAQITVVRNLERAGDHATNIAEQVVYMVEGESIRHRCQG